MVNGAHKREKKAPTFRAPESRSSAVALSEILAEEQVRLEATAYSVEMRRAVEAVRGAGFGTLQLLGDQGLCNEAAKPIRLRRVWVDRDYGVGFLTSSDIISIRPDPSQFVSRKLTRQLSDILIAENDVLISRSGTVGNVALAGRRVAGLAVSEDVIRLRASDPDVAGFASAFLRSKFGRPQLTRAAYGSVIKHIEPEHLQRVVVPAVPVLRRVALGKKMRGAAALRDKANEVLDEANARLIATLQLPPVAKLAATRHRPRVRSSELEGRFDVQYHDPAAKALLEELKSSECESVPLGSSMVARVSAVTKFRKRLYVREGGLPLLPSKQLFQVDPVEVKGLAKGAHLKDLPEIALAENMILVTCSGTIGRTHIVPKYMAAWTASQDALRITATDEVTAGYLFAWLSSEYGQLLIKRYSYGSVVVHIDRDMLSAVPVPLVASEQKQQIGELVLRANALRHDAWECERAVIRQIEDLIEGRDVTT